MASSSSIARKARSKAEADFATWLMMAKLGGFDDLPSNAQSFLINYRARLDTMSEAESTALAVREVYGAYYSEMGGVGAAPEPKARTPMTGDKAARFQRRPQRQPAASAARNSTWLRKSLPALLIFAGMVALIVTYRFLME
jgi:hypothetical protein